MVSEKDIGKALLILNIIWSAILFSLAVYVFIGHFVAKELELPMDDETLSIIRYVFYILTVIILIVSRNVKRIMFSIKSHYGQNPQIIQDSILQKYTSAMIIIWAFSESIGIFGFVLFLLGKNSMDLYLLIIISAASIFLSRPSKDEVINLSRNSIGGSSS